MMQSTHPLRRLPSSFNIPPIHIPFPHPFFFVASPVGLRLQGIFGQVIWAQLREGSNERGSTRPPFLERLKPFGRVQGFLGQSIFPWPLIKWMWSRVIVMGKREKCYPLNGQILRFKCATRVLTLGYWDKSIQKQFPIIRIQKLWFLSKWSISTAQCQASCCESQRHGSCNIVQGTDYNVRLVLFLWKAKSLDL